MKQNKIEKANQWCRRSYTHPSYEKAPRVHTGCKPLGNLVPLLLAITPFFHIFPRQHHREGGEKFNYKKVLAFRQFGFSHDISSRIQPLSLSLPLTLCFSPTSSCNPFHRLLISPFHPLFLPLEGSSLATVARICGLFEPASNHTPPSPPFFHSSTRSLSRPPVRSHPHWPPTLFIKRRYIIFY